MYPDIEMHAKAMEGIYKRTQSTLHEIKILPHGTQNLFSEVALALKGVQLLGLQKGYYNWVGECHEGY